MYDLATIRHHNREGWPQPFGARHTIREQTPPDVRNVKRIAHNTIEYTRPDNVRVVRYHMTDIIEVSRGVALTDREYVWTLNSGGHQTYTTKSRLNRFSPASVYQRNHVWYVRCNTGRAVPFFDGIAVDRNGRVLNA